MSDVIIFSSSDEVVGFGRNYGAYVIANSLRYHGYSCTVVEFFKLLSLEEASAIIDKYVDKNTSFVGFSSTFFRKYPAFPHTDEWMKSFIDYILKRNPNIKFLYGGVYANKWIDKIPFIDLYITGYAEETIIALMENKYLFSTFNFIKSSSDLHNYGKTPFMWKDEDIIFNGECLPLELSRGCIFNCPYCNCRSKNKTYRSIKIIKEELIRNYEKWNINSYFLVDANPLKIRKEFYKIHNMILSLPFKINYGCYGKVEFFSKYPEAREMMLENGCKTVNFGMETLNEKTLRFINKFPSAEKQIETLYFLNEKWKDKIYMTSNFIAGLPYDNEEDIKRTMNWLAEEDCPIHESIYFPLWIPSDSNLKNDFRINPDKWGYYLTETGWISKTSDMTEEKASEMISKYNRNKKTILSTVSYTIPFRLKNLGFIDIYDINIIKITKEDKLRKENLKNEYVRRMLQ